MADEQPPEEEEQDEMAKAMAEAMAAEAPQEEVDPQADIDALTAAAMSEQSEAERAPLSPLQPEAPSAPLGKLDFILDVPLSITVNLGKTTMLIKELLQLGQGSVVELEKMAGEPMDVYIGEKLIARGEVVVVNEKFGIRLTDIVSATERIEQLA
ncbi:MAG: flagellar motor switch protein FliN [Nitrospiria bacterium]